MPLRKVGPHIQSSSPQASDWANVANVVKQMDGTAFLEAAPDHALRIFRRTFTDQDLNANPALIAGLIINGLSGYNHPKLFVEVYNEIPGNQTAAYVEFLKKVVPRLKDAGLKVCGPCWSTGDYDSDAWDLVRAVNFDAIALHAYWSTAGFTKWNALRWQNFWQQGDPPIIVTETGRDKVRDGPNGTYLPNDSDTAYGPFADSQGPLSDEQFLTELENYDLVLMNDSRVIGATAFTCAPYDEWRNKGFDLDRIAIAAVSKTQYYNPPVAVSPNPNPGGNGNVNQAELLRYAADIYNRYGVPFNQNAAITQFWLTELRAGRFLGYPMETEHPTENNKFIVQGFSSAFATYDKATGKVTRGLPLT